MIQLNLILYFLVLLNLSLKFELIFIIYLTILMFILINFYKYFIGIYLIVYIFY